MFDELSERIQTLKDKLEAEGWHPPHTLI
jgi:hypothetical protein